MGKSTALLSHLRSRRGLIVLAAGLALIVGIVASGSASLVALLIAAMLGGALLLLLSIRVSSLNTRVGRLERGHDHSDVVRPAENDARPSPSIEAGRLEERTGTSSTALEKWRRAVDDDPTSIEATVGVARNLVKLTRFQEAVAALDQGPAQARSSIGGMIAAGRALEKMGRLDDSIESWAGVLARQSNHPEATRSIAAVRARKESGVVGREIDLSVQGDRELVEGIRDALKQAAARGGASPPDEEYLNRHSYMRYNRSIGNLLPWIGRHLDFPSSEVIEVGCGTGSTLVGLAMNARHAHGYDIDPIVLDTCSQRARAFGLDNVSLHRSPPEEIQAVMAQQHPDGVDAILLYAVLEHLTPTERLEAISNTWDLLRPGGLLVVIEAPNRFNYFDWHSTQLPFFHQLPRELQRLYFDRSPREPYVTAMSRALASGGETALDEALTRFGQSISFHEFELALGPLDGLVVDDGDHPLVDRVFTRNELIGEDALRRYLTDWKVSVPRGFDRANINVILRRPGS